MPRLQEMWDTCRRLATELAGEPIDGVRLLEIETIVRLLVPHVTRMVASEIQRLGEIPPLGEAGASLRAMRSCLAAVELGRGETPPPRVEEELAEAVRHARAVLSLREHVER